MTDLWSRWEDYYRRHDIAPERICRDGIIDPERFSKEHRRVLFVLRESNNSAGRDICADLRSGLKWQLWHTVARWAAGLLSTKPFPDFDQIDTPAHMADAIQRVAIVNLKKVTGGSSANLGVINRYAYLDQELLRTQIAEIAPTLIVACGTTEPLLWVLRPDLQGEASADESYRHSGLGAWVVPLRHPAMADNRETYETLKTRVLAAKCLDAPACAERDLPR